MEKLAAAVAEALDEQIDVELIDEQGDPKTYKAFMPTGDQMVLFMAASNGTQVEQVTAVVNFIEDAFDEETVKEIKLRVRNRKDPLSFEIVTEALVEAVSDFPTEGQSASTSTRTPTGTRSTGRVRSVESTRSA